MIEISPNYPQFEGGNEIWNECHNVFTINVYRNCSVIIMSAFFHAKCGKIVSIFPPMRHFHKHQHATFKICENFKRKKLSFGREEKSQHELKITSENEGLLRAFNIFAKHMSRCSNMCENISFKYIKAVVGNIELAMLWAAFQSTLWYILKSFF